MCGDFRRPIRISILDICLNRKRESTVWASESRYSRFGVLLMGKSPSPLSHTPVSFSQWVDSLNDLKSQAKRCGKRSSFKYPGPNSIGLQRSWPAPWTGHGKQGATKGYLMESVHPHPQPDWLSQTVITSHTLCCFQGKTHVEHVDEVPEARSFLPRKACQLANQLKCSWPGPLSFSVEANDSTWDLSSCRERSLPLCNGFSATVCKTLLDQNFNQFQNSQRAILCKNRGWKH